MGRRTDIQRSIKGINYKIAQLDARTQLHIMRRLGRLIAPFMDTSASYTQMIVLALDGSDDETLDYLVDKFASQAMYQDGEKWPSLATTWPEHFAGDVGALLEFVEFSVTENFPDLLDDLRKIEVRIVAAAEKTEKESEFPKT